MPFKLENYFSKPRAKRFWVTYCGLGFGLAILSQSAAQATVTLKGEEPYEVVTGVIYFANDETDSLILDTDYKNFKFAAATATEEGELGTDHPNMMIFNLTSTTTALPPAGQDRVVMVYANTKNSAGNRPVPIAVVGETDCARNLGTCVLSKANGEDFTGEYRFAVKYPTTGQNLRLGLYPQDICEAVRRQSGSPVAVGCDGASGAYAAPEEGAQRQFELTFFVTALPSDPQTPPTDLGSESAALKVSIQSSAPELSCGNLANNYQPGDEEVTVNTDEINADDSPSGNAPVQELIVLAKEGGAAVLNSDFRAQNNIVEELEFETGVRSVTGFKNTTNGTDNQYGVALTARDAAGVLAPLTAGCTVSNAITSEIQGVLSESKCFIATAAYQSGTVAPVMLLREFRDQVLLKSQPGRAFVEWYYDWSPKFAEWLWRNPEFRFPVLMALLPFQVIALFALEPVMSIVLTIAVFGLISLGLRARNRSRLRKAVNG